jgi:hypothetical protein
MGETDSVDDDFSAARFFSAEKNAKKATLPRPTRTGDEDELPCRDLEREIRKGSDLTGISLRNRKHLYH